MDKARSMTVIEEDALGLVKVDLLLFELPLRREVVEETRAEGEDGECEKQGCKCFGSDGQIVPVYGSVVGAASFPRMMRVGGRAAGCIWQLELEEDRCGEDGKQAREAEPHEEVAFTGEKVSC